MIWTLIKGKKRKQIKENKNDVEIYNEDAIKISFRKCATNLFWIFSRIILTFIKKSSRFKSWKKYCCWFKCCRNVISRCKWGTFFSISKASALFIFVSFWRTIKFFHFRNICYSKTNVSSTTMKFIVWSRFILSNVSRKRKLIIAKSKQRRVDTISITIALKIHWVESIERNEIERNKRQKKILRASEYCDS